MWNTEILTHLDVIFIELNGRGGVCDGVTVCFEFDICLRPVAEERRVLVVLVYRLCVEFDGSGPVMFCESLVTFLLECSGGRLI